MTFAVLTVSQRAYISAIRSERTSQFRLGLTSNPWLLLAVASSLGLQLAIIVRTNPEYGVPHGAAVFRRAATLFAGILRGVCGGGTGKLLNRRFCLQADTSSQRS